MAVAFILKGYPRLSETFIAQEIKGLEARGLDIRIVSLRHSTDSQRHPIHDEIGAPVSYLPEYLCREPVRVWRGFLAARRLAGYRLAWRAWLGDLVRDPTPNRVRRFGQALVLARELPADVTRLHAHFLHTPASVTRYAAMMTGHKWSVSAHAKDIWTTPDWDLAEKIGECDWLVTCSAAARDRLGALAPTGTENKIALIYHGYDVARLAAPSETPPPCDGDDVTRPVVLLSVGRAVEKKGFDVLIDALARVPRDRAWRLVHIGGGTLLPALKRRAARAGIADRITWRGALAFEDVLAAYRAADLFVLASRVARDGDRDGLPNVLMEAQSQALACVATTVSGIPELIEDGVTGVLVPPDDPDRLATELVGLIDRPDRRMFLGKAGQHRVTSRFSSATGLDELARKFHIEFAPPITNGEPESPSCGLRSTHP
ncbi:MAG: glycosyltransferase family 4 protein [Alphaproteobacteria bacterium]